MLGQMTDNWPRELCMKLGVKSSVFWFSAACQGQGKELQECSSVTFSLGNVFVLVLQDLFDQCAAGCG